MAIQLLPALVGGGRMAMQYLPLITGGFSALEGLRTGGIPGALASGTIGYLGGKAGMGPLRGLRGQAAKAAPGLASVAGIEGTPQTAQAIGRAAVPLAAAALAAPLAGRLAGAIGGGATNLLGGPLGGAAQTAAGLIGYRPDGSPIYGGQAVPGGMGQYGPTDPYGSPLDVLGSSGMARRLETVK